MAITLEINGLTFGYDTRAILDDISFVLGKKEIMAVIGPNGAGKSTLLKCIDGLLKYEKGSICLNGTPIQGMHKRELARYIGYVPQSGGYIFPFSVFDMVLLGRYPHQNRDHSDRDLETALKAMKFLGIENLAMKNFGELSGGQQQKVTIARAIAQEARMLLLDEPTSNLDILHQLEVMALLRGLADENGVSAIISIHDLNLASKYADKIIMLDQGRIVAAGDPFTVLTPENIASVYHVHALVQEVDQRPHIIPLTPLSTGRFRSPDSFARIFHQV